MVFIVTSISKGKTVVASNTYDNQQTKIVFIMLKNMGN